MTTRRLRLVTSENIPKYLTVQQVAERLALSVSTVYVLCAMGEANGGLSALRILARPSARVGVIRIPVDSVERLISHSKIRG